MALVRLTEITLFEDSIFENGDIELNLSERTLLYARKPKDCFGRSYTLFTFVNGDEIAVRETPQEVARRFEAKPLPMLLSQLQGYAPAPDLDEDEPDHIPPVKEPKQPRNVKEILEQNQFEEDLGTNVRRI